MRSRARAQGPPPRASYRIQLRAHGIDFAAVQRELPRLHRLGISHVYLSPILAARRGSRHGYDGIDPRRVEPALGGESGLRALADACRSLGMRLLVDFVPNHLAAHPENPFFADLLARGPASPCADWFDVDWECAGGRIVLPWLTASLRRSLARGDVRLEGRGARARLRCGGLVLPLAEGTAPAKGPVSTRRLESILAGQHYRLEPWRRARRHLNYRRFFDVNELIGVRVEHPGAFAMLHEAVLPLVREGLVAGLRIDHVDGLADPGGYLIRLRRELAGAPERALLVVEKILARGETLPRSWPVDGATGYAFARQAEELFLEPAGARALARAWAARVHAQGGFDDAALRGRRRVLRDELRPDLRRVARGLLRLPAAASARRAGSLGEAALARALAAFLLHLDVYRVYPAERGRLPAVSRRRVETALRAAARERGAGRSGLRVLRHVLLPAAPGAGRERVAAARSVMQLAAAVAAKGVEDTAFYTWTPLLSRNEVGGDPGGPVEGAARTFHAASRERAAAWPRSLLAVSTHDTKRSADVRARLDVLSEIPAAWEEAQSRWLRWNARLHSRRGKVSSPDLRSELLIYQTLVGIWPLARAGRVPSLSARLELSARVEAYAVKAAREAKRETDWIRPDPVFERGLCGFVRSLLLPREGERSRFLRDLSRLVREVARPGLWNALSRTVLEIGAPGIPDVYQGDELWRFDLVDPDNRRPVDFTARAALLEALEVGFAAGAAARERLLLSLVRRPEDGRLKLHVLRRGLAARAEAPALFTRGRYRPLAVRGPRARHVVAFAREEAGRVAVVAVPRLLRGLLADPEAAPVGEAPWGDTRVRLPPSLAGRAVRCHLTGRRLRLTREVPVARLLDLLPAALLLG